MHIVMAVAAERDAIVFAALATGAAVGQVMELQTIFTALTTALAAVLIALENRGAYHWRKRQIAAQMLRKRVGRI